MNIFDWIIIAVLVLPAMFGWARGLLRSVWGLVSMVLSYFLSRALFPYLSALLRGMGLYGWLQERVAGLIAEWLADNPVAASLGQSGLDMTAQAGQSLLSGLNLPEFLMKSITENFNPEAFRVLGADTPVGYISGYFANAVLNLISMAIVFVIIYIALRCAYRAVKFVTKLPVINLVNRLGGLALGLGGGLLAVCVAMAIITLVVIRPGYDGVFNQARTGPVSGFFYANNPIMEIVSKIKF